MKRFGLVLLAAALMAAMIAVMAAPAMALGSDGVVSINPFRNNLIVTYPPDPIREPMVRYYPVDPIAPVLRHNPNIVGEGLPCDGC